MSDDPYAAVREPVNSNLNHVLMGLADELEAAEAYVIQKEQELEDAKDALREISEKRIPSAVEGLEGKFTLPDGRELKVAEEIRASIAKERRVPAIQWLDKHGYGNIVKRQLIFEFDRKEQEKFRKFMEKVGKMKLPGLNMKEQFSVHHMTLTSWVRERLKEGDTIPFDVFGVFRQTTSKVKPAKDK